MSDDDTDSCRRRSLSILKPPKSPKLNLQELGNAEAMSDENAKTERRESRRVSFASKCQVQEFIKEVSSYGSSSEIQSPEPEICPGFFTPANPPPTQNASAATKFSLPPHHSLLTGPILYLPLSSADTSKEVNGAALAPNNGDGPQKPKSRIALQTLSLDDLQLDNVERNEMDLNRTIYPSDGCNNMELTCIDTSPGSRSGLSARSSTGTIYFDSHHGAMEMTAVDNITIHVKDNELDVSVYPDFKDLSADSDKVFLPNVHQVAPSDLAVGIEKGDSSEKAKSGIDVGTQDPVNKPSEPTWQNPTTLRRNQIEVVNLNPSQNRNLNEVMNLNPNQNGNPIQDMSSNQQWRQTQGQDPKLNEQWSRNQYQDPIKEKNLNCEPDHNENWNPDQISKLNHLWSKKEDRNSDSIVYSDSIQERDPKLNQLWNQNQDLNQDRNPVNPATEDTEKGKVQGDDMEFTEVENFSIILSQEEGEKINYLPKDAPVENYEANAFLAPEVKPDAHVVSPTDVSNFIVSSLRLPLRACSTAQGDLNIRRLSFTEMDLSISNIDDEQVGTDVSIPSVKPEYETNPNCGRVSIPENPEIYIAGATNINNVSTNSVRCETRVAGATMMFEGSSAQMELTACDTKSRCVDTRQEVWPDRSRFSADDKEPAVVDPKAALHDEKKMEENETFDDLMQISCPSLVSLSDDSSSFAGGDDHDQVQEVLVSNPDREVSVAIRDSVASCRPKDIKIPRKVPEKFEALVSNLADCVKPDVELEASVPRKRKLPLSQRLEYLIGTSENAVKRKVDGNPTTTVKLVAVQPAATEEENIALKKPRCPRDATEAAAKDVIKQQTTVRKLAKEEFAEKLQGDNMAAAAAADLRNKNKERDYQARLEKMMQKLKMPMTKTGSKEPKERTQPLDKLPLDTAAAATKPLPKKPMSERALQGLANLDKIQKILNDHHEKHMRALEADIQALRAIDAEGMLAEAKATLAATLEHGAEVAKLRARVDAIHIEKVDYEAMLPPHLRKKPQKKPKRYPGGTYLEKQWTSECIHLSFFQDVLHLKMNLGEVIVAEEPDEELREENRKILMVETWTEPKDVRNEELAILGKFIHRSMWEVFSREDIAATCKTTRRLHQILPTLILYSDNARELYCDLERAGVMHHVAFPDDSTVSINLYNLDPHLNFKLLFTIEPGTYPSQHSRPQVQETIGELRTEDMLSLLREVNPGPRYLSRMVDAVDKWMESGCPATTK